MACKNITVRKKKGKLAMGRLAMGRLAMGRQYLIHFAGGAAFVVRVFGKVLTVYTSKYSPDITAGKQVYRTNIKKLFVPSSLKPGVKLPKRMLNGNLLKNVCDIGLAGNSLLAQISNDSGNNESNNEVNNQFKYIYIGHDVVEVTLDEPVEQYYSELMSGFAGNPFLKVAADAPLAYAVTQHYVYFFHTMKRFDRDAFPSLRDVVPPLNPAADYSPAVKTAMRKTAKRIIKKVLVPFTNY
jgi:hypothetical protein